ncbi:hypothetical protein K449DRAFT_428007 [Hypoxylon sp. EC38]|nr:hypothetical protein K449DRAFT_428007 [Hypoxylon sp. EC38]
MGAPHRDLQQSNSATLERMLSFTTGLGVRITPIGDLIRTSYGGFLASTAKVPLRHRWDWRIWIKDRRGENAGALSLIACLVGKWRTTEVLLFIFVGGVGWFLALAYDTPSVF